MMTPSLQAVLAQAKSAYGANDFGQAAEYYAQAAAQYRELGDIVSAAEMENNRSVALLRDGKPQEAFLASQGTEHIFLEQKKFENLAVALGNQAAAKEASGELDAAILLYQQSNDILKRENRSNLRGFVLQNLSSLYLRRGRFLEAMAAMEVALTFKDRLSIREKILLGLLKLVSRMLGRS